MLQCRFQRLIDAILHEDFEEGRQRARVAGLRSQKHALGESTHGDCNITIHTTLRDDNPNNSLLALVLHIILCQVTTLDRQCHAYVCRRLGTHACKADSTQGPRFSDQVPPLSMLLLLVSLNLSL